VRVDHIDFTPAALRTDLSGGHVVAGHVHSAAEMIDHAADLLSDFAGLVHDNERRWRVFRSRVRDAVDAHQTA
jgi:riboflavin synthase alpha subunit